MTTTNDEDTAIPTLTKERIAEEIQRKIGFASKDAKALVELIVEEIKCRLETGENVKLSGFGKWSLRDKKLRPGRNPHTGDKMIITARRVVSFHPSDRLRAIINGGTKR